MWTARQPPARPRRDLRPQRFHQPEQWLVHDLACTEVPETVTPTRQKWPLNDSRAGTALNVKSGTSPLRNAKQLCGEGPGHGAMLAHGLFVEPLHRSMSGCERPLDMIDEII